MKQTAQRLVAIALATTIAGCGVDTVTAAANARAATAEESKHAKNTVEKLRGQIATAVATAAKRGA